MLHNAVARYVVDRVGGGTNKCFDKRHATDVQTTQLMAAGSEHSVNRYRLQTFCNGWGQTATFNYAVVEPGSGRQWICST